MLLARGPLRPKAAQKRWSPRSHALRVGNHIGASEDPNSLFGKLFCSSVRFAECVLNDLVEA